jgi:hypothetical protein
LIDHLLDHRMGLLHVLLALVAEIAPRVPGWPFGLAVTASAVLVILVGIGLMLKMLPGIVENRP